MVRDTIDDRLLRSVELWSQVAALDAYRRATVVMAYVGVGGEPDTEGLIARAGADGKTVVLPRVDGTTMVAASGALTRVGSFAIPEPDGPQIAPHTIDVVIVPGLAFTADGRRLGQGRGYYDRFLPSTSAVTIGACFKEHLVDDVPTDGFDIAVDHVIWA